MSRAFMKLNKNSGNRPHLAKKPNGFQIVDDPRDQVIKVYLTADEKSAVERLVATTRYSNSEYCRRRALQTVVLSDVDSKLIMQLSTLAGELRRQGGLQKHLFQNTESGKTHQNALANNLSKINRNLDDLLSLVLLIQQQKENKAKGTTSDSDSDGSKDKY